MRWEEGGEVVAEGGEEETPPMSRYDSLVVVVGGRWVER